MKISNEMIAEVLADFFERSKRIKEAGGIALMDVENRTATVPAGWHPDEQLYFFVPPGFSTSVH
jgi:hypothetical protein